MTAALVTAGALVVIAVAFDVWMTVLHPTLRGPLSSAVMAVGWYAFRAISRLTHQDAALVVAGPVVMVTQFAAWLVAAWLGFALVYAPWVDSLAYAESIDFGAASFVDALYLSGATLTTVGFGDVVAHADALRLLAVLEGATGLAVITAAIAYLLSVFPLVSEARVSARTFGTEDLRQAVALVLRGGPDELSDLRHSLVRTEQSLQRFPVLDYFHSRRESESLLSLVHGSALVCAVLRWGVDGDRVRHAPYYGRRIQDELERFIDDYTVRFLRHGWPRPRNEAELDDREVRARGERLRGMVAEQAADGVAAGALDDEFARFLRRAEAFLAQIADRHCYAHTPLLGAPAA